jgi:hypothetical protein
MNFSFKASGRWNLLLGKWPSADECLYGEWAQWEIQGDAGSV